MNGQELPINATSTAEEYEQEDNQVIGFGGQGAVDLVRRKRDGKLLARKQIHTTFPDHPEREFLEKLKHPHIIEFFGCDYNERRKSLYIYMEYCPLRDLNEFFKEWVIAINDYNLWQILAQLASALVYCHHGIGLKDGYFVVEEPFEAVIHRDIKPSNVLVSSWKDGRICVKLCDFGICRQDVTTSYVSNVGTAGFKEPESVNGWTLKSDIYSLGRTMRELTKLKKNFVPSKTLGEVISNCENENRLQRICSIRLLTSIPKIHRDSLGSLRIRTSKDEITDNNISCFASGIIAMVANLKAEPKRLQRLVDDLNGDNFRVHYSITALEFAVRYGEFSTAVHRIFEFPYIIASTTKEQKRTLLHLAVEFGDLALIRSLMGANVGIGRSKYRLGAILDVRRHLRTSVQRVQGGVDPNSKNSDGCTLLYVAVRCGHEAVVKFLLEHGGVDPNSKDNSGWAPIHHAARSGHGAVVKSLLEHGGVDPNSKDNDGWAPIHYAARWGHEALVKFLLEHGGVDPNSKTNYGWAPIHHAANDGHEAVVKFLLEHGGVDPNSKDNRGWAPIHDAARYGHEAVVKFLLEHGGVDPNPKDNRGETPLYHAAYWGRETVVKILLAVENVDLNFKNNLGNTPVHVAAMKGYKNVVKLLASQERTDLNSKNNDGDTPLHCAAKRGDLAVVKLLLERQDVDLGPRDNCGDTPLQVALEMGHKEVVKFLEEAAISRSENTRRNA